VDIPLHAIVPFDHLKDFDVNGQGFIRRSDLTLALELVGCAKIDRLLDAAGYNTEDLHNNFIGLRHMEGSDKSNPDCLLGQFDPPTSREASLRRWGDGSGPVPRLLPSIEVKDGRCPPTSGGRAGGRWPAFEMQTFAFAAIPGQSCPLGVQGGA